MVKKLIEGVDYYYDEHNRWVWTEHYLRKRGYCCKSGCKHCPYGFNKKNKNNKSILSKLSENYNKNNKKE